MSRHSHTCAARWDDGVRSLDQVFKARLQHHLDTVPVKEVTVERLFFNGYGEGDSASSTAHKS